MSCDERAKKVFFFPHVKRSPSNDYSTSDADGHAYVLNLCGPLVHAPNVSECAANSATQTCQTWDNDTVGISCGDNTDQVSVERTFFGGGLPALTVRVGGGTERFGVAASTVLHFVCNGTQSDAAPSFFKEVVAFFEYHFLMVRPEVCAGPTPTTTTAPPTTVPPPTPTTAPTAVPTPVPSSNATDTTMSPSTSSANGNGTTAGTTTAPIVVNGTTAAPTNGTTGANNAPEAIDERLIIVLAVLGSLVVIAITVLVCVYVARRRKRLSGYSALLQNPEKFTRI